MPRRLLPSLLLIAAAAGVMGPATAGAAEAGTAAATRSHVIALQFGAPRAADAGPASDKASNFVKNFSFERPVLADGAYVFRRSIPSWQTVAPSGPIEIDRGTLGPARDGQQYVELDSTKASTVSQTIVVPRAGVQYGLSLSAAGRPGLGTDENDFSVTFAGFSAYGQLDATNDTALVWRDTNLITFTPSTTTFTLSLISNGPSNGVGMFVDRVTITRI